MSTTFRAMGALNALLHVPTGMVVGFLRDPAKAPYLRYCQLVPAPEILFEFFTVDPDEPVRLVNGNEFGWGYDDYRPTGEGFKIRGKWTEARTGRWDFPYTLGDSTVRVWEKAGVNPKMLYDSMRANHASLWRAVRIINLLSSSLTGANAGVLNTFMGTVGAYFDKSSGSQYDPSSGADNPNFQIIKKAFQRVKRRINLSTNGLLTGEETVAVMPPIVAEAIAASGEMTDFLKQSVWAKDLTNPNVRDWNLPPSYAGFTLVVEDTPRCFVNQNAAGTIADVTISAQKDYILNTDTIYFVSRAGGLDGGYGFRNFSTIQLYHFNGEARVEAFYEAKHELIEGHVVYEDKEICPAPISGFALSDVLST